jgi:hypothetical protein
MNYLVKHTMVGPYPFGRVVSGEELAASRIDVNRLLGLGAVEETEDPESSSPLPNGPENVSSGGTTGEETVDLNTLTKAQLLDYAEKADVEVTTRMTKEQIIDAIQAAQPEPEGEGEAPEPEDE